MGSVLVHKCKRFKKLIASETSQWGLDYFSQWKKKCFWGILTYVYLEKKLGDNSNVH